MHSLKAFKPKNNEWSNGNIVKSINIPTCNALAIAHKYRDPLLINGGVVVK